MKTVAAKLKAGDFEVALDDAGVAQKRIRFDVDGEEIVLSEADGDYVEKVEVSGLDGEVATARVQGHRAAVVLDVELTEELKREGLARDLVRLVQQARKKAELHISDRIRLRVEGDSELGAALEAWHEYVSAQTLAVIEPGPPEKGMFTLEGEVGETSSRVGLTRV
jgi:hypothetical protein